MRTARSTLTSGNHFINLCVTRDAPIRPVIIPNHICAAPLIPMQTTNAALHLRDRVPQAGVIPLGSCLVSRSRISWLSFVRSTSSAFPTSVHRVVRKFDSRVRPLLERQHFSRLEGQDC